MRRLSHPLSAYVCAVPPMPLVTLEAAVTPCYSKEADACESDRGWACRPELPPSSGFTVDPAGRAFPEPGLSHIALATGDESSGRVWR